MAALPHSINSVPLPLMAGSMKAARTLVSQPNSSDSPNQPARSSQMQAIIDSGSTLMGVPMEIADAVNRLFDPPGKRNGTIYTVNCSAKPPEFGVVIGGQTFVIDGASMVRRVFSVDDGSLIREKEDCIVGLAGTRGNIFVLGNPFLENVLTVFDVGHKEMRFAARKFD